MKKSEEEILEVSYETIDSIKAMHHTIKLVVLSIVLFGLIACIPQSHIVDDGYKTPYIKSLRSESFPINDSGNINDVVFVEIEHSHQEFDRLEFSFLREHINNHELYIQLKHLKLRNGNSDVMLDSMQFDYPTRMMIYYNATPYTVIIGKYRFTIFVSKENEYSIHFSSTK